MNSISDELSSDEFREVVSKDAFDLALQPIVACGRRAVSHFEALIRFHDHPVEQSPASRILMAEKAGLIQQLDLAVARRAADLARRYDAQGERVDIAINLSGLSLSDAGTVADLEVILAGLGPLRARILLELTETAEIKYLSKTNKLIQGLRAAGHRICLDDFGAAAGAFSYLWKLDVDIVKLDGSQIRIAASSKKGIAFLQAMAQLCRELGVQLVAEAVEDERMLGFLQGCGIDMAQGYVFGPPQNILIANGVAELPSNFPGIALSDSIH